MRRPTDAEAHRARSALIEGRYPDGMQARCASCGKVRSIAEGEMRDTGQSPSTGAQRYFVCAECVEASAAA